VLFRDMRVFRAANQGLRLYQRTGAHRLVKRSGLLGRVGLVEAERLMPEMSDHFVVPKGQTYPAAGARRGRVALLTGCVMSTAYAAVHEATIRVLTRNGFEVTLAADQQCCGALNVHAGDAEGGRRLARQNVEAFDRPEFDAIIVNAAGCGAALKEYGHLLHDDPEYAQRAAALASRTRDAIEFLADCGLSAQPGALPLTVTYQEPCHLAHAQRISRQPRALLAAIPELHLREMPESSMCCGSAGIYNLLQPEMSSQLLERKLDNALSTGAEAIVSANPGCMLQLSAGLLARGDERPVVHLMTLLDRAYAAADYDSDAKRPNAVAD
jgi:glycolate oxidase iron-sulfur subunit